MPEDPARVEQDRQTILEASARGTGPKFWAYTKLTGPGWLQGAITLGGGSLAGSLYLGVLSGYSLMWLQPLAMILGIVMLSAIGYVSLSTNERPFDAINKHINPVLGWGWAIATLMANLVWCMPQFALGTAAFRQNIAPGLLGVDAMPEETGKIVVVAILFAISGVVIWFYNSGGNGIKLFEKLLKIMVAVIVLSFFGVVVKMTFSSQGLPWGEILAGFIPDFSVLTKPSAAFTETLSQTGTYSEFWSEKIVSDQQKVMITAAATAVGINMTFLLPYSMLARGWDRDFRGLAIFDLSTGLFIPFMLATSCVVIASASQFHGQPAAGFVDGTTEPAKNLKSGFNKLVDSRIKKDLRQEKFSQLQPDELEQARKSLPEADRKLAAMLVTRDAFNLADSLKPLTGKAVGQYVFGIGVFGMAVSSIIILMLINGFVICEMLGLPSQGTPHRAGCYLAALSGAVGSFFYAGEANVWLAVPTSMFGMVLLPIAYITFFLMINSKSLLGENRPQGVKRLLGNFVMGIAVAMAAFGSFWSIKSSSFPVIGFSVFGAFLLLAVIVHFVRKPST